MYLASKVKDSTLIDFNDFLNSFNSKDLTEFIRLRVLNAFLCLINKDLFFNSLKVYKVLVFRFFVSMFPMRLEDELLDFSLRRFNCYLLAKISEILT